MTAAGVNPILCVVAAVLFVVIVAVNIYVLVYFQNEEDKNTAIFPKIVTVFTFTMICVAVLLMPMDVANRNSKQPDEQGIPMPQLWEAVFITMGCLAFIVPFAFFYYESEDPDSSSNVKQIKTALKWALVWAVCFFVVTTIIWLFAGTALVPYTLIISEFEQYNRDIQPPPLGSLTITYYGNQLLSYKVSWILYTISMLTFCGTFILVFFGGVGLAALPMDLINGFRTRPKPMSATEYAERKLIIGKRASALLEKGREMKKKFERNGSTRPKNRRDTREYNRFRTGAYLIEQEFNLLEKIHKRGGAPMILYIILDYFFLFLGFLGIGLSILWLLHIILFMAPINPYSEFLNTMFTKMDNAFGLFGTAAYALFTFYLLWCVIKGLFKVGVRIPLFCTIHPMKVGETLMNAFLFNAFVLLLGCFAVINFCSQAFSTYAVYTGIDILFNVGTRNLQGIGYFFRYYYWGIVVMAILSTIYLLILPSDKKAAEVDQLEELPR